MYELVWFFTSGRAFGTLGSDDLWRLVWYVGVSCSVFRIFRT